MLQPPVSETSSPFSAVDVLTVVDLRIYSRVIFISFPCMTETHVLTYDQLCCTYEPGAHGPRSDCADEMRSTPPKGVNEAESHRSGSSHHRERTRRIETPPISVPLSGVKNTENGGD